MDGERECVKFLPGLDLTFLKACPCMTWPSAEQRQRLLSSDSLKAARRPGLCILAPSEADGFALNPETNGHPRPRGLPARQSPLSSPNKSLLGWDQPVFSSWSSGSDTPPCSQSPSLWVLCSFFHGFSQRQKAECLLLQGESRRWSREEGGRQRCVVIKHCRGLNK